MTTHAEFDRIAAAWLADGPTEVPERVLDAAVDQIHLTRQRHALRVPWRFPPMSSPARIAALVAAVALVAIGALALGVGSPAPAPSVVPTTAPASASAASSEPGAIPALDQTFTSARNGFSIDYPSGWTTTDATETWTKVGGLLWGDPALDVVRTDDARLVVGTQRVPTGQTPAEWLTAYCRAQLSPPTTCDDPTTEWTPIKVAGVDGYLTADGIPALSGTVVPGGKLFDAVVLTANHAYDFALDGNVTRDEFDALLSSVQLSPIDAVDLPGLTKTFVSPTYGYSIPIADDWVATAATERWTGYDNSVPMVDGIDFTGTDTGLTGASQVLPKGMSYPDWLSAFHEPALRGLPAGCDGGDPSTWPPLAIGDQTGSLQQLCNAAEGHVLVGDRVYVFDWGSSTFDTDKHLSLATWKELLKSITFSPDTAKP